MNAADASPTLSRVLDRLGSTLLSQEAGPVDLTRPVTSVVLDDSVDPPPIPDGSVVLGVGIEDADHLLRRLDDLAQAGASAIVIRNPVPLTPEVTAASARLGIPVFGFIRGASWVQLTTMLSSTLDLGPGVDLASGNAESTADLFELAESLAALLQAPVTIEDLSSRVLAFSADQAGTDKPRRLTILGLQVPARYNEIQRSRGAFRRMYASDRPVFLEAAEPGTFPRVVMRVQAGNEVLGSIWAVVKEPLSPQREQGMVEGAGVVAMTMLRARLTADASQRLRLGLVSTLLDGGTNALDAARQLGMRGPAACVIAISSRTGLIDDAQMEAETQRVAGAFAMYLKALYPRAVAALLGGVVYAVLPLPDGSESSAAEGERIAAEFIARLDTPTELYAGVGGAVLNISELPTSRRDADAALRVLRTRKRRERRAATLTSVQMESLLLRIADHLLTERVSVAGPLALLQAYDAEHDMALIDTLRAWLDHFGDVASGAAVVHVHKNTFRYRLTRIREIGGIDLDDAEVRFQLMLRLRLLALG